MNYKKALTRLWAKLVTSYIAYRERNECAGAECIDVPDPRDYPAPKISYVKLPKSFNLLDKVKKHGWTGDIQKDSECTAFSKIIQAEITNSIWNDKLVKLDPWRQWANQEATGAKQGQGDSIQNAQEQFRKDPQNYPISEYFRLMCDSDEMVEEMKLWIYARFTPIHTGLKWRKLNNVTNYYELKKTGFYNPYVGGSVVGAHAIAIVGWDGDYWIVKESLNNLYGTNQTKGVFKVHMDFTKHLFSKYVVRDLMDSNDN